MKPIWRFRLLALLIVVFVGGVSISNLVAELLRPAGFLLPSRTSQAPAPDQVAAAGLASAIAPFRADLKAEFAMGRASQVLKSENAGRTPDESAQIAVRNALNLGPHDARMWLVLAVLQARNDPDDSLVAESLKMSYLTGSNQAELIPARLDIATINNSLNDADLKKLAGSDIRSILNHFPDLRPLLVNDYIRGSATGRRFLEESAKMVDPKFADSLQRSAQ